MKATSESTSADDRERERREGSVLWAKTEVLLNERDSLLAEVQRLRASQPDPAKARAARTAKIESVVLEALGNATLLADVMAVNSAFRVGKVIKHLARFKDRYGIEKPPCRKTVSKILQDHDYM